MAQMHLFEVENHALQGVLEDLIQPSFTWAKTFLLTNLR
jgi:hypothetical protein